MDGSVMAESSVCENREGQSETGSNYWWTFLDNGKNILKLVDDCHSEQIKKHLHTFSEGILW